MAVAFDAVGTAAVDTNAPAGANIDFTNMTVGSGSNRALCAIVCYGNSSGNSQNITATWDQGGSNQAMSLIGEGTTGIGIYVRLFGLVNPVSGNKTLRFATTAGCDGHVIVDAISFTSVDQTGGATTFINFNSAAGSSATASVTITSATDQMVVAGHTVGPSPFMSSVNNTTIFVLNSGSTGTAANYASGAASVAMTATLSSGEFWESAGFSIKASVATSLPFNQSDWPVPIRIQQYGEPYTALRTWTDRRVGMLGQDKLPNRQQDWPVPIRIQQYGEPLRTWTDRRVGMFGQDVLPNRQMDWPVPIRLQQYGEPLRTWTDRRVGMFGQDILPNRQQDWPVPIRLQQYGEPYTSLRSWTDRRVGMFGQDVLPNRQQDWPVPVGYQYHVQLRTWVQYATSYPAIIALPFNQFDWPIPIRLQQYGEPYTSLRSWTDRRVGMFGQDKLPNRQQDWPVPRAPEYHIQFRAWTDRRVGMLGFDKFPIRQMDWPVPMGYQYHVQLRNWTQYATSYPVVAIHAYAVGYVIG